MNEELTNKATLILDKMLDAVNTGVDKAPEFAAGLASEYVVYFTISFVTDILVGLLLIVFSILFARWAMKSQRNNRDKDLFSKSDAFIILWMACVLCGFAGPLFFFSGLQQSAQAYLAPKAFLIENVRK